MVLHKAECSLLCAVLIVAVLATAAPSSEWSMNTRRTSEADISKNNSIQTKFNHVNSLAFKLIGSFSVQTVVRG